MDQVGAGRAVVGGISLGGGAALRFALRFRDRTAGLIGGPPTYRGKELGFTEHQAAVFRSLFPVLARAAEEGVEAFRPLYRERGMETHFDTMTGSLDLPSYIATNQSMASGAQPFAWVVDLESIGVPTLLFPGNDLVHAPEIAALYAARIPRCTITELPGPPDYDRRNEAVAAAIGDFCDRNAVW